MVTPSTPVVDPAAGLAALLEAAAEAGARRALVTLGDQVPSALVPLHDGPIPYRLALKAIAKGELQAFGTGKHRHLSRAQVEQWILAHPIARTVPKPEAEAPTGDEVDEVIASNRRRQRRRGKP
jgi:hypothetical protein